MSAVVVSANVRLLADADLDRTVADLRTLAMQAGNVRGRPRDEPTDALEAYLQWTEVAERRLTGRLSRDDITKLIHTPRYWALRNLDGSAPRIRALVNIELEQRQAQFEEVATELETIAGRWSAESALIVVPDTNVLVEQPKPVDELDWWEVTGWSGDVRVVVPLVVIDELDRLKSSGGRTRGRAHFAIGRLHGLIVDRTEKQPTIGRAGEASATLQVLIDPPAHDRLPDQDYEIIDRAVHLRQLSGGPVRIVTGDLGMQLRALERGIETTYLPPGEPPD